jgi:Methylamine utilisation protein MauE
MTIDPTIAWTASLVLAANFIASAAMKFADLDEFRGAIESYRIAPALFEPILTFAIPLLELFAAIGLIFVNWRVDAATALIALLVIFSAAIAINLGRGRVYIDCGCFGPALRQKISWWLVARNAVLATLAVVAALPAVPRDLGALDFVTIALGAATLVTMYAAANYLLANAPRLAALEMSDA